MRVYWRVEVSLHAFLTSALYGGKWPASRGSMWVDLEANTKKTIRGEVSSPKSRTKS